MSQSDFQIELSEDTEPCVFETTKRGRRVAKQLIKTAFLIIRRILTRLQQIRIKHVRKPLTYFWSVFRRHPLLRTPHQRTTRGES